MLSGSSYVKVTLETDDIVHFISEVDFKIFHHEVD